MSTEKMSYEEFYRSAILRLRRPPARGIHVVFSGFNKAVHDYYGADADPRKITGDLVADGKIAMRPSFRGIVIYLPEDVPEQAVAGRGGDVLAKITGKCD